MPAFRFDNVLGIARNVRAFLSIEGGVTRGSAPEDRRREISGQFETMRRRIQAQDDALRKKDAEISRLEERLRPTGAPTGALPDFVVIGAQKSGTTSFYRDVIRHPHVGRSTKKEVHFFDHNFDKGLDWYRAHFPSPELKDGRRTITGEASPYYLAHSLAPERAAKVVPQAKLIALLRNPANRAYSHYQHAVRYGRDPLSFEDAIEAEEDRMRKSRDKILAEQGFTPAIPSGRSYLARGVYVDQLLEWNRFFDRDQLLVLKAEDYFADSPGAMKTVLDFLGLPDWEPEEPP
ncbi:MAG: sulfotransferase domain-containing protein, partial [Rubrobacteraceae bacterium]